ncbi:MAG: MmgE/PrpD family protein [Burkholderiales bacterium]|nr:MmgE/PrpD family protein [Burkholderiales bacterium]
MKQTIAERLAEHFTRMRAGSLPAATRHGVKRLLLDYLGVAIAGSRSESGRVATRYARSFGGKAQATLIGNGARVPMEVAGFANAICSHSIELDDIDVLALFHFSPPVYSAALAAGEAAGASGKDLVAALAAGCEMMERASKATNNALRNRGFHTTPTCGVFGATVAAARLLGLDAEQMTSALGLAGAQASGLMEMYGPSMQKRFNPGPTARNGVTAASIARQGFTGAATIFEGERGFCNAFSGEADPSQLVDGLQRPYKLEIEFKPYSCARPIHNAIDCALDIRQRYNPDLNAIARIVMTRHPDWAHYHQNATPRTYHEAQVSLPFSVAVALKEGAALLKQYTDANIANALIKRLSGRVEFVVDKRLPRGVSCKMSMELADGRKLVSQVDYPKGSIQNPMSDAELRAKFDSLAAPVLGEKRSAQLAEMVQAIERCDNVRRLMQLTAPAPRR